MLEKQLSLLYCILTAWSAVAQDAEAGHEFINAAKENAIADYYRFTGRQSRLFNGIEHAGYNESIKGDAYFLNNRPENGFVVYDRLPFREVSMLFDIYRDEVVVVLPGGNTVSLLSEKVQEFNFMGHHFVNRETDNPAMAPLPPGFYDHIYEGKTAVIVKRIKLLEEKVTNEVEQEFLPKNNYFILKKGLYRSCNSYQSLLYAMKDRSKEIRRYLRKNKIKFKTDPEIAILMAAKRYDASK